MPDNPHTAILDRTIFRTLIGESFSPQMDVLEQMVNYGTNLLPRCYASSNKRIPDTVAILSFLKHAVSSLDAIHILAREGAILACMTHIRSLFEIDLNLRWIFREDFENRATAYFVWSLRRKRYWLRCYLEGTPEYAANIAHMEGSPGENITVPFSQEVIQAAIAKEDRRLQLPEVADVNRMFDQHMSGSGKDVEWYRPFGPTSIRDMAIRLGDEGHYKVFYSQLSRMTHGLSLENQFHFDAAKKEVIFDHIRTLDSLDFVLQLTFTYSLRIYKHSLEYFRYGELDAFSRKYITEWRAATTSIPKVKKDGSTFTIS